MKNWISVKLAGNILIGASAVIAVLQILVIFGVIPFDMLWGGNFTEEEEDPTLQFQLIVLFVTFLFGAALAVKVGYIKTQKFDEWINLFFWIMFIYFIINGMANLASGITFIKMILAFIALILAFFTYRLVIEK
ncbi:MAG: hypothetical protein OEZ34_07845 [Spirochaetia bacterium]|nr:hypothetical protein [Spirochaetia bacterium]